MKDQIEQRITEVEYQLKMVDINYKNEMQDSETRYKKLYGDLQDMRTILYMALNSPSNSNVKN